MFKLTTLVFLMMSYLSMDAQFGIRVSQNFNSVNRWDEFLSSETGRDVTIFASSQSIAIDYWFRLANQRVEFYPYLSFHRVADNIVDLNSGTTDLSFSLEQIGGGVWTHIYAFDLVGDCDCPTFSKQGGFLKKGFFFLAGLGADFSRKSFVSDNLGDGNFDFKTSIGVGVDIGITDLVTISPFVMLQRYFDVSGHDLSTVFNRTGNISSSINQLQIGLRIGLRPDY